MSDPFTFYAGSGPLLVSVPHDGHRVPSDVWERMTSEGKALPDTDWHVARLYDFVRDLGVSLLVADYSRYVVDLNRPSSDEALYPGKISTGVCPEQTFAGDDIYMSGGVLPGEAGRRVEAYWLPYHAKIEETLGEIRARHGFALLWDAHSIASSVPRLFDGELPELNIGTFGGRSCAPRMEAGICDVAKDSPFSFVANGRFQGGYITRHYGDPANGIHAVQLEIAQRAYMDEAAREFDAPKASRLRDTLQRMLETYMERAGEG
jgi:N-formylglutamate amidohydrolase